MGFEMCQGNNGCHLKNVIDFGMIKPPVHKEKVIDLPP